MGVHGTTITSESHVSVNRQKRTSASVRVSAPIWTTAVYPSFSTNVFSMGLSLNGLGTSHSSINPSPDQYCPGPQVICRHLGFLGTLAALSLRLKNRAGLITGERKNEAGSRKSLVSTVFVPKLYVAQINRPSRTDQTKVAECAERVNPHADGSLRQLVRLMARRSARQFVLGLASEEPDVEGMEDDL